MSRPKTDREDWEEELNESPGPHSGHRTGLEATPGDAQERASGCCSARTVSGRLISAMTRGLSYLSASHARFAYSTQPTYTRARSSEERQ